MLPKSAALVLLATYGDCKIKSSINNEQLVLMLLLILILGFTKPKPAYAERRRLCRSTLRIVLGVASSVPAVKAVVAIFS